MSKFGTVVKTTTGIVTTTVALLAALRENPQIAQGVEEAVRKLKATANSENVKLRLDAKVTAIETAADAIALRFPEAAEPTRWRHTAEALRMRTNLAWGANTGLARRQALKALEAETSELLAAVNARLIEFQTGEQQPHLDDGTAHKPAG